jgi:virginiamycin B lyase
MALRSTRLGVPVIGRATRALAVALFAAALFVARAGAQEIEQFNVPGWQGITLGPDGAMWLPIGDGSIGRMTTDGSVTDLFPLPIGVRLPAGITAGPDGNLWFTTRLPSAIGRITTSGNITMFAVPLPSLPYAITSGPDGNLWFTMPGSNRIGRMSTTGALAEFPVPTPFAGLSGITAGPDGNLWFTEAQASRIGRITTAGDIAEFALASDARPNGITTGPDGNLWFTELAARVGRITTAGVVTEFAAPALGAGIVSSYGTLWVTRPGEITQVTTNGNTTSYTALLFAPSAVGIAKDSEGRIWMTDSVASILSRVLRLTDTQPDSCVTDATTLCLNNGRFKVRVTFRAGAGPVQDAQAVGLTADTGYFWFFNSANIEIVAKVLSGCSVNGHYWNFLAGLTDVEVTTTVTDTVSGATKVYTNPAGTPFAPVQDTSAFVCP